MSPSNQEDRPRRTLKDVSAAAVGNALEFYDFIIYALFAVQIGRAFFPSSSEYGSLMLSLATFGAGFVTRPLGAIVVGAYADRVGRRSAMVLCLALIGGSMAAMALIPPYASIGIAAPILAVLARMLQGFSVGGEVGANGAFLAEVARPETRGATVSWLSVSQHLAAIAGSLIGLALTALLSPAVFADYGWRIAFLLGAATLPVGWWLRRNVRETLQDDEVQSAALAASRGMPMRETAEPARAELAARHRRVFGLGFLMIGTYAVRVYILTYIVTYAEHALRLSPRAGFSAQLASLLAAIPATLIGGRLSDRYGRWPVNVWGNLAFLAAVYPIFAWMTAARSEATLIAGMTLLGVVCWIPSASFLAGIVEALPRRIRSGGFGTTYSLAVALFGGTTQLAVTWLLHVTGSAMAPAWYVMGFGVIGQIAFMLFPETAPARLQYAREWMTPQGRSP